MFTYDESWNYIESILKSNTPFKEGWLKIIAFHEEKEPNSYWSDLKNIDFEKDLQSAASWFFKTVANEPIPNSVIALWFGIFQTADEDGSNERYIIYFTGSNNYDEQEIENWALDPVYSPDDKYFEPEILNLKLKKLKEHKSDNYSFLNWILPISYITLLVQQLKNKLTADLYITVGYDDGDYINLR